MQSYVITCEGKILDAIKPRPVAVVRIHFDSVAYGSDLKDYLARLTRAVFEFPGVSETTKVSIAVGNFLSRYEGSFADDPENLHALSATLRQFADGVWYELCEVKGQQDAAAVQFQNDREQYGV